MRYRRLQPGHGGPALGLRALPASRSADVVPGGGGRGSGGGSGGGGGQGSGAARVAQSDAALAGGATAWPAALVRVARRRQSGVLSLSAGKLVFRGARASAAQSLSGAGQPVYMRRSRLRVGALRLAFASDDARDGAAAVIANAAEQESLEEMPSTDGLSDVLPEKSVETVCLPEPAVPRSVGQSFVSSDYLGTEIESDIVSDMASDCGTVSPMSSSALLETPPPPREQGVAPATWHAGAVETRPSRLDIYLPFGRAKLAVAVLVLVLLLACVVVILTQLVRSLARLHILLETY